MKFFRKLLVAVASLAVVFAAPATVSVAAISEEQLYIFGQNGIYFWNPDGHISSCTGDNRNYAGAQVWTDSEMGAIEANRPFYEAAATQYDISWQVLAVIHSQETSLQRYNPASSWDINKSEGAYQLHSWAVSGRVNYPVKSSLTDEEFMQQTMDAAQFITESYSDLDLSTDEGVMEVLFRFNGTAPQYKQKALNMGFTQEEANRGEGSVYVMNRFDERRDPTSANMSSYWPGRFEDDGVYVEGSTTYVFGTFVKYAALGGSVCSYAGGAIATTALDLAWPAGTHSKDDPKPEYVVAMRAVGFYHKLSGSNGTAPEGASCDQFVATVMRYSGADENFPEYGPGEQKKWMDDHPEMYEKIDATMVDDLQPGDIFVTVENGKHIYLYVGEVDGRPAQASASANERTGEYFNSVYFQDNYGHGGTTRYYEVYRRIDY